MRWYALPALLVALPALAADLSVKVDGIEHAEGTIRLSLYDDPEAFRDETRARMLRELPARKGAVTFELGELNAGSYAVMVYHDEDGDKELDRLFGMIPTEGYGLSLNPRVSGPPAFKESAFEMGAEPLTLDIEMRY